MFISIDRISALELVSLDKIRRNVETTPINVREKKSNAEFCRDYELKRKRDDPNHMKEKERLREKKNLQNSIILVIYPVDSSN